MILPGTYTVSGRYLPRERDVEIPRYQTTYLTFPEISFIGDLDISTFTNRLQISYGNGRIAKFTHEGEETFKFKLYHQIADLLSGDINYTLFSVNPSNAKEHHALYKGIIRVVECDNFVDDDVHNYTVVI